MGRVRPTNTANNEVISNDTAKRRSLLAETRRSKLEQQAQRMRNSPFPSMRALGFMFGSSISRSATAAGKTTSSTTAKDASTVSTVSEDEFKRVEEPPSAPVATPATADHPPLRRTSEHGPAACPNSLNMCLKLLSKDDADQNRLGLERLFQLTKCESTTIHEYFSKVIIFGDESSSYTPEGQLQLFFVSYLCDEANAPAHYYDEDDGSEDSDDTLNDCQFPTGRHWGSFHGLALKVLANCLERVRGIQTTNKVNFASHAWRSIIKTLHRNIQDCNNAEIAANSIKCLRRLQALEPAIISSFVRYTLLPFLISAKEYGELHNYPTLGEESVKMLKLSGVEL